MNNIKPLTNQDWLNSLYQGELYKLPVDVSVSELVEEVNCLLHDIFQVEDIFKVHSYLNEEQFFSRMKVIRKQLFEGDKYINLLKNVFMNLGFRHGDIAFEPLRLRAIRHNGHLNPRAKSVYYPHRDTWYGHGQSMIVGWIPLHDQQEFQTFEIYPDWLRHPVPNDSEVFDYSQWRRAGDEKKIGWQKPTTGLTAVYPQTLKAVDYGNIIRFSAKKSEQLYFSGAHYHKTIEQECDLTRFSVDYRFVYRKDYEKGVGAFNSDNRSKGSAVQDYIVL